jgi:aminoglycoside phosphotransferase (APT) family kinase protein
MSGIEAVGGATLNWVVQAAEVRRVLSVQPISLGSTAVHRLRVQTTSATVALVLRRFVDRARLHADPWYDPRHEATALRVLEHSAIAVPRLIAADLESRHCDVPTLLTTCVEGRAPHRGWIPTDDVLEHLVTPLPHIHSLESLPGQDLPSYAPYYDLAAVCLPAWSQRILMWQRVFEVVAQGEPRDGRRCFIHRDYHPGNTLWNDGRLSGVIDWTTACYGPSAIDLARMRQTLAMGYGPQAARRFLTAYVQRTGQEEDHHPWWDLRDALDLLPDTRPPRTAAQAARLERWEHFIEQTASELT